MSRYNPDRATFESLLATHAVVPVWRRIIADSQTPVAAFLRLEPSLDAAFLLESVEGGERWGRYSFLGGDSSATVVAKDGRIVTQGTVPVEPIPAEPPLAYVRRLLDRSRGPRVSGLPPFYGGAVGFIGFDCVRELESLPNPPPDDLGLPDLALLLTRTMVVFDHLTQSAFVVTNAAATGDAHGAYDDAVARCDAMIDRLAAPLGAATGSLSFDQSVAAEPHVSDEEFAHWVKRSLDHIVAGDVFQVVPSRRFEAPLAAPAFNAYRALRVLNPSPYMYFLRVPGGAGTPALEIAGSSPEPLVRVSGGRVTTRPIAGTRRRGADDDEDAALERELRGDAKERAEHVMLVDLARNDVGRVATFGSVAVDDLMRVERYSHVMHLVSSVSGDLDARRSAFDALLACFPAGTVSGAPKVRAIEIIDSLERTRRGPYAGVVGYFDFAGNLDVCITIRTIIATGGRAYVQAGAGVVADSVPEREADETRRKAEALLRAVAASALVDPAHPQPA